MGRTKDIFQEERQTKPSIESLLNDIHNDLKQSIAYYELLTPTDDRPER